MSGNLSFPQEFALSTLAIASPLSLFPLKAPSIIARPCRRRKPSTMARVRNRGALGNAAGSKLKYK
jgi:hypothetical protein